MLGSLTFYRRILHENFFLNPTVRAITPQTLRNSGAAIEHAAEKLPTVGHGIAGVMAGWTVSFIAAPVEHIKARLQIQYAADKSKRLYSGPIDCSRKIVSYFPFSPALQITSLTIIPSSTPMAFAASITASSVPSSSVPSSSSGGAPTTCSLVSSHITPLSPILPSTFGPAASPLRSSGLRPTPPTWSSSVT